jgi:uncharacterized protein YbcI
MYAAEPKAPAEKRKIGGDRGAGLDPGTSGWVDRGNLKTRIARCGAYATTSEPADTDKFQEVAEVPDLTQERREGERRVDADVSREIVRIHAHYYGRGPTKAKSYVNEEIVLCVLGEIYTPSEKMLIEAGRFNEVRTNRMAFQDTVEPIMRESVERITGREVDSFLSQISIDGRASEVFVLVKEA